MKTFPITLNTRTWCLFRSSITGIQLQPHLKRFNLTPQSRPFTQSPTMTLPMNPNKGQTDALIANSSPTTFESAAKRQKLSGPLIGTHNGHFHADEALAVFLLRLLPEYTSSPLLRTRNPEELAKCHTVVDVGGEYDASTNRFDHHQRGFNAVFPGRNTKLSAAGLVYLHFGKAIIATVTGLAADAEETTILHEKIYADLIEAFDGNDNGVDRYDFAALDKAGITRRYDDSRFSLASVVGRYNHRNKNSQEEETLDAAEKQRREDERFEVASQFVGEQFVLEVTDAFSAWLPARGVVRDVYSKRRETHPSGRILVLPHRSGGLPWADHLYEAEEEEASKAGDDLESHKVLYVLFPESGAADSKWRIRSVSTARGQFTNRKDMPDSWKGLRDEELSKVTGIPGGVFVHASGFIGGNQTFDGVLAMAVKAVEA